MVLSIKYGGKDNINISVVSNPPLFENEKTYFSMMYNCTNGLKFDKNVNDVYFLNTMLNHIYGEVSVYPMCILSNNWKHVRLTAPITGKHVRLSKEKFEDLDASDLQGCADTDEDGLYDFQEIMFEFNGMKTMIYDENDEAAFAEPCLSVASLCQGDKILVDKVPQCVINFCNNISHSSPEYYEFISKKIVFVHSDPTKVDSDGDGYWDCINNDLNKPTYTIADAQLLKFNKSSKTPFTYIPARRTYESTVSEVLSEEHQKYLYFLAAEYGEVKKDYFYEQRYEIDGYLLIGVCLGESGAGKDKPTNNYFGAVEGLLGESEDKAKMRMNEALLSSGVVTDLSEKNNMPQSEQDFYLAAARVLSYWDNTYNNPEKPRIDWNHTSLIQANPNVVRWREEINNGLFEENTYEYRCYDFKNRNGKYAFPDYPWDDRYDDYVYVGSKYYNMAYEAIRGFEEYTGYSFWTGLKKYE